MTAKGGDLLNRTLENYRPRVSREAENLANGDDDSDAEQKTPSQDKGEGEEPGSTGARVTRGMYPYKLRIKRIPSLKYSQQYGLQAPTALRHHPPQRALFGQPESAGRQARSAMNQTNSPTPGSAGLNGAGVTGAALSIMNYEPVSLAPASVKPIQTPANDPKTFRDRAARLLAQQRSRRGFMQKRMAPGSGFGGKGVNSTTFAHVPDNFIGPSIYSRTLSSLQSGVPKEVQYALHHLVKISHERGDKYRFDQFTGLAEALLEKVLDVSQLYYGFKWHVNYSEAMSTDGDVLNALSLSGTANLLEKISTHRPLGNGSDVHPDEYAILLSNINEAGLVLRNMVIMDENAWYLARMPLVRDVITIILQLPPDQATVELQTYALDIAESLTKFFVLDAKDPMYISLLSQLDSDDRGNVITSLRALSRIAMNYHVSNRLPNAPMHSLRQICEWLLVEDEELRIACLDFLYMYTAITDNVKVLLKHIDMESLVATLVRALMQGATPHEMRERSNTLKKRSQAAEAPPKLSKSIIEALCQITDEKEQSSQWLQTCFEADPDGEITQLALWSAYNDAFSNAPLRKPLMAAKDFITNVSSTFSNAQAQVIYPAHWELWKRRLWETDPEQVVQNKEDPSRPKYTIKGVRPRAVPVDSRGRPYLRCLWRTPVVQSVEAAANTNGSTDKPQYQECDLSVARTEEMWEHIVSAHLGIPKDPESGKFTLNPPPILKSRETDGPSQDGTPDKDGADTAMPDAEPSPSDENKTYACHWSTCAHFPYEGIKDAALVARHLATHLPDSSALSSLRRGHNRDPDHADELLPLPLARHRTYLNTAVDEQGQGTGVPLAAVLVLRNLALQMGRVDRAERDVAEFASKSDGGGQREGWVERCFLPWRERLMEVYGWNLSLSQYMGSLIDRVDRAVGVEGVKLEE